MNISEGGVHVRGNANADDQHSGNPSRPNIEDIPSIAEQLARIQQLQEEALVQRDREILLLRSQLDETVQNLSRKENEIRQLERERYRQEEQRAMELGSLARRSAGVMNNPYTYQQEGSMLSNLSNYCQQTLRPMRFTDWIQGCVLVVLVLQFYHLSRMPMMSYSYSNAPLSQNSLPNYNRGYSDDIPPEPIKPWDSTPPKPIALMDTNEAFVKKRHVCIRQVREKQVQVFETVLGSDPDLHILLVDPAYFANVGDHMLTVGEMILLINVLHRPVPEQCHYVQAGGFYPVCNDVIRQPNLAPNKIALWQAGGNWGDLWRDAQTVRIPSIKTILQNGYKLVGMPQSLYYVDEELKVKDSIDIKVKIALGLGLAEEEFERRRHLDDFDVEMLYGQDSEEWEMPVAKAVNTSAMDTKEGLALSKSKAIFMWREKESYEEAESLYPFVTNMIVPDMAFQLGPFQPIRKHPHLQVDILLFLRNDKESKVDMYRSDDAVRSLLPKQDLTFRIVEWSDRLELFDTKDIFFTDTSIQLLSLGKIVVCDRLHASVLSYLSGMPFVYIDQISGKVTKAFSAAFDGLDGCLDGERSLWARASTLQEALTKASDMIEKYGLTHGDRGFLRRIFSP